MDQSSILLAVIVMVVAALGLVLLFAIIRLLAASRHTTRQLRESGEETAFLTTALEQSIRTIREQERATKARAEASERLSGQIIASLSSGLLVVDVDGVVQILNPAARRMLGVTGDPSARVFRALAGARARALADLIDECLGNGLSMDRRTLKLDGPVRPGVATHLGVSVSPMLNDPGVLQGAICLFANLSAVVDLEERLRLQDSLARVGELTAGIAHEFRNGLATIHGYGRLIDPEELPERYRPYLAGIRQETVALREVVDNFLRFARPSELSLATVGLAKLAQRVAEEIQSEARERGGEVRIAGTFPDVEGDEVLLRQAISNLCRNAVDACLEAGVVPVVTLASEVDTTDDTVRITVSDNGPGFDPATRDQIFTPFFTTKSTGTGLGLALTQKIIVTHNGRVTATTAPGGGACIEVVLPLHSVAHRT